MKYFLLLHIFFLSYIAPLNTQMHLPYLENYSLETCLEMLENITLHDLWDHFLSIQTDLYIEQEAKFISRKPFWENSQTILELGCGNGAYLHGLSKRFKDKDYLGTDNQPQFIEQSKKRFQSTGIDFEEDDAEVFNANYEGKFDIVIARLLLQHVENPFKVLENAHKYLKPDGHLVIVDAYDPIWASSHIIPSLNEATRLHNEINKKFHEGNRKISLQILNQVTKKKDFLANLYEAIYSNISQEGALLDIGVKFTSERERKLYFNQILLYLNILNKERNISVNLMNAHQELQVYLNDENSWVIPPLHLLILKKKH